ncbi:MAG: hypothetical protein KatS3mg076_2034 [Candidatus Binatia bacterium]|nr:MAG: hypothetical protein KatS3mg076_2034 [Candidatus Binatia bacterium]
MSGDAGAVFRVAYLGGTAALLLLVASPWLVAAFVVAQALAWAGLARSFRPILLQLRRFSVFALFVLLSYAFTSVEAEADRWVSVGLAGTALPLNVGGLLLGALMLLRVFGVVAASQIAREGDPRAVARGLLRLGVPERIAVPIDLVLDLLGPERSERRKESSERKKEKGEGSPGGSRGGFLALRQRLRGLGPAQVRGLVERVDAQIERARRRFEGRSGEAVADMAVVAGVSLAMLGFKAVKVLPGLPVAPGHKMVVLLPLYVFAALRTRSRLGATYTGLTMGSVAFLMGDGRYGVFEILKHVTPGALCDLVVPLVVGRGRLAWCLFGALVGSGRFATTFAVVALTQAPAVAYAFFLPELVTSLVFGFFSGYVAFHLARLVTEGEVDWWTRTARRTWAGS